MYIYDVLKYFGLQSFAVNNGHGGMNEEVIISGKVRKSSLLSFFAFTGIFVFCDITVGLDFYLFVLDSSIYSPLIIDLCAYIFVFIEHQILFSRLEKKTKIDFYQRQLPSNLKPAHVRMLANDGLIDEVSVGITLMDLIDKGYLKIKEHENDNDFFKYNDEATLIKTDKDTRDLLIFEEFLIDWFIDVCGDGNKVTKKELHDRLGELDSITSNDRYNDFKAYVIVSYPFYKLYKRHLKAHKHKSFIALICILSVVFTMFFPYCIATLPIIGFGLLFFNNPAYTLNDIGSLELNNWLSLKKFLHEFSIIKEKNAEMLVLWSYYLTYSVALNENRIAKDEIIDFFGTNIHVGDDAYSSSSNTEYKQQKLSDIKAKEIEQVIENEKMKYNYKSMFIK